MSEIVYNFCIEKMPQTEIRQLTELASKSILTEEAKWCDLVFGGVRHQLAYQNGISPEIGEVCHLERKWRGKGGVNEAHRTPGDKGLVHLVSDETGCSYGVLMQSEKKLNQIRQLDVKKGVWTNQEVRNYDYFLNPYTVYRVIQVIKGNFVFVERVGPDEFELATGRHNYEEQY